MRAQMQSKDAPVLREDREGVATLTLHRPESRNALNLAIRKFEGTVILVTHDEDLIAEVATRIWQFDGGRIVDFKGSYEEFQSTVSVSG